MSGRVAIVTGASRGIGRAIAERLGADGLSVLVNYHVSAEAADNVVATIEAHGGRAVAVGADVTDASQLRGLFDLAEERFGGLDVLVHNARSGDYRRSKIAEATDEEFEMTFTNNTRAAFVALREAARRIRDGGRIVMISSGAAVTSRLGGGLYGASKAAVDRLVRSLAVELGPRGITVNSVLPGATLTETLTAVQPEEAIQQAVARTPLGRIGQPEDIAEVVAFLASDAGRWITAEGIRAGGGLF